MVDMMAIPETPEEFIQMYSFKDSQELYTNGSQLMPVYRVEQLLEYYFYSIGDLESLVKDLDKCINYNDHKHTCSKCKYRDTENIIMICKDLLIRAHNKLEEVVTYGKKDNK